jgi:hypothetical protein
LLTKLLTSKLGSSLKQLGRNDVKERKRWNEFSREEEERIKPKPIFHKLIRS